jgi:hypothetical protein
MLSDVTVQYRPMLQDWYGRYSMDLNRQPLQYSRGQLSPQLLASLSQPGRASVLIRKTEARDAAFRNDLGNSPAYYFVGNNGRPGLDRSILILVMGVMMAL